MRTMSYQTVTNYPFPRLRRGAERWMAGLTRIGEQTRFYGQTLRAIPVVVIHHRAELARQIATMGLGGTEMLIVIGGTVGVVAFMMMSVASLTGIIGYSEFASLGVEALTGFASAFFTVRFAAPMIAVVALCATLGAATTAQLGAMRINEEIDALDVIGVRSIAYLATTRVMAAVIVVAPLYCVGISAGFMTTRFVVIVLYGQSTGVYSHYFFTFLNPTSLLWSLFQVVSITVVTMLVHTYYGYTASGGPAGVGEAVGRAVRASLITSVSVVALLALAIYGQSGHFHFSG